MSIPFAILLILTTVVSFFCCLWMLSEVEFEVTKVQFLDRSAGRIGGTILYALLLSPFWPVWILAGGLMAGSWLIGTALKAIANTPASSEM